MPSIITTLCDENRLSMSENVPRRDQSPSRHVLVATPVVRCKHFGATLTPCEVFTGDGGSRALPRIDIPTLVYLLDHQPQRLKLYGPQRLWQEALHADLLTDSTVLHLSIDHYFHLELLSKLLNGSAPAGSVALWIKVATPHSAGGLRAGNDAADLAHAANEFINKGLQGATLRGFVTTIDFVKPSSKDLVDRDRRLLERTRDWAASEGLVLETLQQLHEPVCLPVPQHERNFAHVISTIISRPSLGVALIDLGVGHFNENVGIRFPDHPEICVTARGWSCLELLLTGKSLNLRIGDQIRMILE